MKKNLLTMAILMASIASYAQQDLTYIGDNAKLYLSKQTLLYSGGNLTLKSTAAKSIENNGNIMIVGKYNGNSYDGKEFYNTYTDAINYGQVQILSSPRYSSSGFLTMQKPSANSSFFGADYPISLPFESITYQFWWSTFPTIPFVALNCIKDRNCGDNIFKVSLRNWNNNSVQLDPVNPNLGTFIAGQYFILNLRPSNMQQIMTGLIDYKGNPAPAQYSSTAKSVIYGETEVSFSNLKYDQWRGRNNQYGETYMSYLGQGAAESLTYAKNIYNFGNPYTSNLDLSAFDGTNAWLKILNGGIERTIMQATTDRLIKNFTVQKPTDTYDLNWNPKSGTTQSATNTTKYSAVFDGLQWTGNANALLIKPFEVYSLYFKEINPTTLSVAGTPTDQRTRIVSIRVNLNDNHKTFSYVAGNTGSASTTAKSAKIAGGTTSKSTAASALSGNPVLIANPNSFYQAEVILSKDNTVISNPAYFAGSVLPTENSTVPKDQTAVAVSDKIYAFGLVSETQKDNTKQVVVNYNFQKAVTSFNSSEYKYKPMGLGFNNLTAGEKYTLNFNLTEGSIFNPVEQLSGDKFYLVDDVTKKTEVISSKSVIEFVASNNDTKRFTVFWAGTGKTTGTPDGTLDVTDNKPTDTQNTFIYEDGATKKIHFEKNDGNAILEVYDVSGKLVSKDSVSTSKSAELSLPQSTSMYIIKVIYKDGTIRTLKTLN